VSEVKQAAQLGSPGITYRTRFSAARWPPLRWLGWCLSLVIPSSKGAHAQHCPRLRAPDQGYLNSKEM